MRRLNLNAADLKRFLQWVLFNLCVGNNDSHAKNLSVLQTPDGQYRLAPFYDLMCTALYPGLARNFAFAVGGESRPGHIGRGHLDAMARELGFSSRYVAGMAQALVTELPSTLETVQADLAGQATAGTESTLLERLGQWIRANTRKLAKRWELPG